MFYTPIKSTRFLTLSEVISFSVEQSNPTQQDTSRTLIKFQDNGNIAYITKDGKLFVTPYRQEIDAILSSEGFTDSTIAIPRISSERYRWLQKIANQEFCARRHEEAHKIAVDKKIRAVSLDPKIYYKQIFSEYTDGGMKLTLYTMFPMKQIMDFHDNIGSYIIIDEQALLVCDEYGQTFLIKTKGSVINGVVNELITSGYLHNANPEKYVKPH